MKITLQNLEKDAATWAALSAFGIPISQDLRDFLKTEGVPFAGFATCAGWVWTQWLLEKQADQIRVQVASCIERGLEMGSISPKFRNRSRQNLYLMVCAIFTGDEALTKKVAKAVVDSSGWKKFVPVEASGELYASAWCGMLKHWVLGNREKAASESEIAFKAYRHPSFAAATKPLVAPWLKGDWTAFEKQQQKDFAKLWARVRKSKAILKETDKEMVLNFQEIAVIESFWCWAHCALALLAHKEGATVATDPLFFPAHALKCAVATK